MRNFLEFIDFKGDDIICLLDDEGNVIWKLWVKLYLINVTKKLGIIIFYLTSYEKFFSFVIYERFNKLVLLIYFDYMAMFVIF